MLPLITTFFLCFSAISHSGELNYTHNWQALTGLLTHLRAIQQPHVHKPNFPLNRAIGSIRNKFCETNFCDTNSFEFPGLTRLKRNIDDCKINHWAACQYVFDAMLLGDHDLADNGLIFEFPH